MVVDFELSFSRDSETHQFRLFISSAAAQTGSFRQVTPFRHAGLAYDSLSCAGSALAVAAAALAAAAASASFARFSATNCLADLCKASAFSLLMPSTS